MNLIHILFKVVVKSDGENLLSLCFVQKGIQYGSASMHDKSAKHEILPKATQYNMFNRMTKPNLSNDWHF
jgi:hypothetical protein